MIRPAGFTLVEVMLALAIAGLVLTSLSGLQNTLMRATVKSTARLDRIRSMLLFLEESRMKLLEQGPSPSDRKRTDTITKEIKEPSLQLTYERLDPPKGSSLSDFKDLKIERVKAQWKGTSKGQQDTLFTVLYTPEFDNETGHKPA